MGPSRWHKSESSDSHHTPTPTKSTWHSHSSDSSDSGWSKPDTHSPSTYTAYTRYPSKSPTKKPSMYSSSSDGYWKTTRPSKAPSMSSRWNTDGSLDQSDSVSFDDPRDTYGWHGGRGKKKKKKKKGSDSGSGKKKGKS